MCDPSPDEVARAVEVGRIATRQKKDPYPIDPAESILRALCEEEQEGESG